VLLQTALDQLPATVTQLVKAEADLPLEATPAWERGAWSLRPGPDTPANRQWLHLSPTALKSYLACPTRFYFERVLRWDRLEPFDEELDGKAFGNLFHTVLDRWAKEHAPCRQTDPDKLRTVWLALLEETVKQQFGDRRPPLMQLQFMSARERLLAFAPVQAGFAAAGWEVVETEKELAGVMSLAGIPLKVRIDRIDRHPDGRVRVLDYKTARKGVDPRKAHLRVFEPEKHPAPLGQLTGPKANQVWVDLQLPLYAMVAGKALDLEATPEVGYIQLSEAVTEIKFSPFEELDDCLESALAWAETAAQRIRDGVFWPPAPEPPFDRFAGLAPDGLEKALEGHWADFLKGAGHA
jgi:ATP-dependent helicase/nuclease subunit B